MTRRGRWRAAAGVVSAVMLVVTVLVVTAPWFQDTTTYGFHDWDVVTSFRYLVKVSLLRYGEFPGWNPYACGGYPLWGYVEGGTNLVSPWLPVYLILPMPLAIRIETVGMGLLGAVGAYLLASRFTASHGARLLVVALWAVNGRWALQIAAGHTWHLSYAWLPWCLFFYDRACRDHDGSAELGGSTLCEVSLAGSCLAMLIYSGGIYPLPHTVLLLSCYGAVTAAWRRSLDPLALLVACGLVGIGLSAPKLLPILDTFSTDPRLIASDEKLDLGALITLLTDRDQGFFSRPARVRPYGWHEWGMYISAAGLAVLALAAFTDGAKDGRLRALKISGVLFLLLGLGSFHELAPWPLLHEHVPVFRSQHVPSRFLYPAVLVFALVASRGVGEWVWRRRLHMPWLDLVVAIAAAALALDVALVAQKPMRSAMWMVPPKIPDGRTFHHEHNPPFQYQKRDWAGPMLLSMMGNTGVLNCYGVPRKEPHQPAAIAVRDRSYRGEAVLAGGGIATVSEWSPNSVAIALSGVVAEDRLIYNMNYRGGWSASIGKVVPTKAGGLSVVDLPAGATEIRLRYRPPGLLLGLLLAAITATTLVIAFRWRRRGAEGQKP